MSERKAMIDKTNPDISVSAQSRLLRISRSGLYYRPCGEGEENLAIQRLLDEQYLKTPFYGVRRIVAWLGEKGYHVNRKRARRLMEQVGWQTIYRAPRTTTAQKGDHIYPYLLRNLEIGYSNQVWATDITYIPMKSGFMYLCAVIDLYSRYIVGWGVSNTMSAAWCTAIMEEAIMRHGVPEIVNTDQGSQFTSAEFTGLLKDKEISISMDGKGRAIDNIFIERLWRTVKYEHIYLHVYEDGVSLYKGLEEYLDFYNNERLHQSLNYSAPDLFYEYAGGKENKNTLPGAASCQAITFATEGSPMGGTRNIIACHDAEENHLKPYNSLS